MSCYLGTFDAHIKRFFDAAVLDTIQECFTRVFERHNCAILALNHDRNHLHIFSAPPQVKLSDLVCALKMVSSSEVRKRHSAWLRKFYWKPAFWSRSYYLGSVGDTTAGTVEIYIHNQGKCPANKYAVQLSPPESALDSALIKNHMALLQAVWFLQEEPGDKAENAPAAFARMRQKTAGAGFLSDEQIEIIIADVRNGG